MQNNDDKCFLYSTLAGLHKKVNNRNKVATYRKFHHELNMEGLSYPMTIQQLPKFEAQNKTISIGVLSYSDLDSSIIPIYRTKYPDRFYKIHLLLQTQISKQTSQQVILHTSEASTNYLLIRQVTIRYTSAITVAESVTV